MQGKQGETPHSECEDKAARLHVVVDRSRWLRGEGALTSYLLRGRDGRMCCLGFACLAAGNTEDEIRGVSEPLRIDGLHDERFKLPGTRERLNSKSGPLGTAMEINDDPNISDVVREGMLIGVLAPLFDLEFVDGPVMP